MVDFYQQRQQLDKLAKEVADVYDAMKIDDLKKEVADLTELQHADGFWNDVDKAQEVSRKITVDQRKIKKVEDLQKRVDDAVGLLDLIEEMDDESEVEGALKEVSEIENSVSQIQIEALLSGKYDGNNAILTLHAGAGGTEAQDWAEMLYRMYTRYAERQGYQVKVIDRLDGDEAGIKSITFQVNGEYAYGYLHAEMGVHRLVRISPFDANKRRHTSFASLEVMPEITDADQVTVNPDEIRVDTYRSGGAGGQHIQTVPPATSRPCHR